MVRSLMVIGLALTCTATAFAQTDAGRMAQALGKVKPMPPIPSPPPTPPKPPGIRNKEVLDASKLLSEAERYRQLLEEFRISNEAYRSSNEEPAMERYSRNLGAYFSGMKVHDEMVSRAKSTKK